MENFPKVPTHSSSHSGAHPLWLRISAFLSLKSPNTRETYVGIVREFCGFLGAEAGSLEGARKMLAVEDLHALSYKQWLEGRRGETPRLLKKGNPTSSRDIQLAKNPSTARKKVGLEHTLSNATIAKKLAALRRLYRMLQASDLGLNTNPFDVDRIPPPPKEAGKKRPTEMVQFEKVLEVIQAAEGSSPRAKRDRAILASLFGCGLRRSELVGLRLADLRQSSSGTPYFYLRSTKAKRDAEQALPGWAARLVLEWKQQRLQDNAQEADFLFPSYSGKGGQVLTRKPMSASGIYKLFKYYCHRAGAGEFLSPHSARATAITKLLADGIPHREVQEFSRHSSVQMVEVYDKRRIGVDQNPAKSLDFSKASVQRKNR